MEKVKTIAISSEFAADAETIWCRLLNIDTLQTITKPMMTFLPATQDTNVTAWVAGKEYAFKIRLFGLIPFGGCHTIEVLKIDAEQFVIQTHEQNSTVTVWDHRIELRPLPNGNTHYTDIVELYAGCLTPIVAIWSKAFYRHRQRNWKRLLREVK